MKSLLAFLLVTASVTAQAGTHVVPMEWNNQWGNTIEVDVNDGHKITCVIDTGAYITTINVTLIKQLGDLKIVGIGRDMGVGGPVSTIEINTNLAITSKYGSSVGRRVDVPVHLASLPIDCLLGESYFRQFSSMKLTHDTLTLED